MQQQHEPMKKWKLRIDNTTRACNVILPASYDELMVYNHLLDNHPNAHRWFDNYDFCDEREPIIKLTSEDVELLAQEVKQIWVKKYDTSPTNSTAITNKACNTSSTYKYIKTK